MNRATLLPAAPPSPPPGWLHASALAMRAALVVLLFAVLSVVLPLCGPTPSAPPPAPLDTTTHPPPERTCP